MTQKDSKVSKASKVTAQAVLGKQLQTIFGRLHNLYDTNTKLWQKIAELEQTNIELRGLIKEAA